jgi:DNA-binding CsgD family transcriptional regulator
MHICANLRQSRWGAVVADAVACGGRVRHDPPVGGEVVRARPDVARMLLAVEGAAASASAVERLVSRLRSGGYELLELPIERAIGRAPSPHLVLVLPVAGPDDAGLAVQAALRGFSVLVVNHAARHVADRLYDDLRRFGRVEVRSVAAAAPAPGLSEDERDLLELLASGKSLGDAASALHLSRRTADRRLASARRRLGASTTPEAIARFRMPAP